MPSMGICGVKFQFYTKYRVKIEIIEIDLLGYTPPPLSELKKETSINLLLFFTEINKCF
jgi:hypothetical protein